MTNTVGLTFEGVHSTLQISRPKDRVVVVTITGTDVGELRDAPFRELEADLRDARPLALFFDTRDARGASMGVHQDWAVWLRDHRDRFSRVTFLPGSRYVQVAADFVRRFAELGDKMCIVPDAAAFDAALAAAVGGQRAG